jgi:disulfide bond formation protein DsbB
MLARTEELVRTTPVAAAAAGIAAVGAATIAGAWFFQLVLGIMPCPLCLEQRLFYYAAIPIAVATAIAAWRGAPRPVVIGGLALAGLAMLGSAALGAYHSGVEWHWWAGPQDCSGPVNSLGSAGDLLKRLQTASVVRCDEASWRFLGLSLAGYNVLISLTLVAVATWGIRRTLRAA